MMTECKLTTNDNPYDPFNNFDEWYQFDMENNHNSCSMLMRIANINDDFTELEYNNEIERAIDFIIKHDVEDKFKKLSREYEEIA